MNVLTTYKRGTKTIVSEELAQQWKRRYMAQGVSMQDLRAEEAAAGRNTSEQTIKRELQRLGVKIKSMDDLFRERAYRK